MKGEVNKNMRLKLLKKQPTLCSTSKAFTMEAAQNLAHGSSSGAYSIEAKGQARQVFSSMPACLLSAKVHKTCGMQAEGLIFFIKCFSFNTCSSFPSCLTFCFENLFKLSKRSETR